MLLAEALERRNGGAARDDERQHLDAAAEAERRWIEAGGRPSAGLHLRRAAAEASPGARGDAVLRAAEIFLEQGDLPQAALLTAAATGAAGVVDAAGQAAMSEAASLRGPVELDPGRVAALESRLAEAWVAEGEPSIIGGAPLVAASESLCVCGSFPRPEHAYALHLDGMPLPVGAVRRQGGATFVTLPADLSPGRHVVTGDPSVGFADGGGWRFELFRISDRVDHLERLVRGGRGALVLTVEGTRSTIELELRNHTPGVVRLEGGEAQMVRTSGGRKNSVRRGLQGLADGASNVTWVPRLPPCPCAR
jgi:hypothetical protein